MVRQAHHERPKGQAFLGTPTIHYHKNLIGRTFPVPHGMAKGNADIHPGHKQVSDISISIDGFIVL
jgi:hypothetical protein